MNNKEKSQLQKEIISGLESKPHGRLLLAPRSGKTKLVIDLIKRDKPESILWVTPSATLATEDIPKEFETWKAKKYLDRLTTVTWTSLPNTKGHYECVVLDEEQFITENNIISLLNYQVSYGYIISMTGKASKKEEKELLYQALNLKVLYELDLNEAVNIGLLSNYKINIITVPLGLEKNILGGNKENPFKVSEKKQYLYLSDQVKKATQSRNPKLIKFKILARLRAVKNSPSKHEVAQFLMDKLQGRKLMFCSTIDQANIICKHTYHSRTNNEDLQSFIRGDIQEIAMVNAGGTGFTYKNIDHLVVVQVDSDNNGLTSQKIARTLLKQGSYQATVWIVSLLETQDEVWIENMLKGFDKSKVIVKTFTELKNELC